MRLTYETIEDRLHAGDWRVEAVNDEADGEVYIATFTGPKAKERAEEYEAWKNGGRNRTGNLYRA